ncbi:Dipeptide transport system permease protein DppB [Paraconexibacter sp. AEG42_29]|uniref:Dipeptide transport system permease protein DppB n=1 Tax=Paraconexibacter sp. AEG42_29 TaxID=2997339 RepID=A0AAU7B2I2_9ACTN
MAAWLLKRLCGAVAVIVATVIITAAIGRWAVPGVDSRSFLAGVAHDTVRMLLHLDFGTSSTIPSRPRIHDVFAENWGPDLALVLVGVPLGALAGRWAGTYCAANPGALRTRALNLAATLWLCAPIYFVAYALLLLFEPSFGRLPIPLFFEPGHYGPLLDEPWGWLQAMLVPWVLVAAPIGAAVLRVTTADARGRLDEPYVRTALAKGLSWGTVARRHAARPGRAATAAFVGVNARVIMLNVILVENVFFVPGFLVKAQRAVGDKDLPMLQGLAVWTAVLTGAIVLAADVAAYLLEPRTRAG